MKLSNLQLEQVANTAKIVAIGQFIYIASQSNNYFWLILSAALFVHIIVFGVLVLGYIEDEK